MMNIGRGTLFLVYTAEASKSIFDVCALVERESERRSRLCRTNKQFIVSFLYTRGRVLVPAFARRALGAIPPQRLLCVYNTRG